MSNYPLSDKGLTIFLFHGVVHSSPYEVRNYTRKHIISEEFKSLLEGWKKVGTPLSMDEVVRVYQDGGRYPSGSFAVTFDDGFQNNLTVAAPILEALSIPAMFYVTTHFIDNNAMSWIDRIEWTIERTPKGRVSLPWRSDKVAFSSIEERISLLTEIRREVKSNRNLDVINLISRIFLDTDQEPVESSQEEIDQKLTWDEVRTLHSHPLFSVGGHSHTHPILSFLSKKDLEKEIDTSLSLLEEKGGISTRHYSYPEGLAHCFNDDVIDTLKSRGVVCSPTAISGINTTEDPFHLYRVMI